jgi:flagellar hook assembly protein FlgD
VGPNNEIWVGTYQGGLPVFHYGTWLSANNGTVIHPSFTKNGIKIIPNPTHGITNITLNFTETGRAAAIIYNTLGQRVKTLFDEDIITPEFAVNWDGRDDAGNALTAGVYFCSLKTANNLVTKRIILIPQ